MPIDERLLSASLKNPVNASQFQSVQQPEFALAPQTQVQQTPVSLGAQQGVDFVPVDQQFSLPQQDMIPVPIQTQVSTTSTPGIKLSPEIMKGLQDAEEKSQYWLKKKEEAMNAQGAAEAEYNAKMVEERNAMAAKQAEKVKEIQQNMQSAKADYDKFKVEAANSEVDPNKFFDGKVENQVMAALLAGAGAWSSAMTGGQNYALNIINQAVERDIEMQKIAMSRKDARAQEARRQYEQLQNRFGDADNALAMMRLDAIDAMGKKLMSTASNDNLRANLAELIAQNAMQKSERQMRLYEASQGKSSTTVTQTMGGNESPAAAAKQQALVTMYGPARNMDSANKVNQAAADHDRLTKALNKAIGDVEKYGNYETVDAKGKAALSDALMTVVQTMQSASNSGVLNPGEFDRFKEEVPLGTVGALFTRNAFVKARLEELKGKADENMKSLVKTNIVGGNAPSYKPKSFKGEK